MDRLVKIDRDPVKGRGVYAAKAIRKGTKLMTVPFIILSVEDTNAIEGTRLQDYVFEYDENRSCLVMGICGLLNHSDNPNLDWELTANDTYTFFLVRGVKAGEELLINYGYDPTEEDRWIPGYEDVNSSMGKSSSEDEGESRA